MKTLKQWFSQTGGLTKTAGSLLIPELCPVCLATTKSKQETYCPACHKSLIPLAQPHCNACGGTIDGALSLCSSCLRFDSRPWENALSIYPFHGPVRQLIHRFKYQGHTYLALLFAEKMSKKWVESGNGKVDMVVPIPLHWFKQILRGYNQSHLLCMHLAKQLETPISQPIYRKQWTRQQARLNLEKRQKNIRNAFALKRNCNLAGKHILLIDDIFTTGATLNAAATLLIESHATVSIMTIARG